MKKNIYKECISTLEILYSSHPSYTIAQHISTAMADYGDFWGLTDREFLFALEKYSAELELDNTNIASEEYVNKIVEDGKLLFSTPIDEEEEY
jgi:hypothetical protein